MMLQASGQRNIGCGSIASDCGRHCHVRSWGKTGNSRGKSRHCARRGRDWGNQHVNDVRRLPGGWIFDGAEFGSEAALAGDEGRVEAKQAMMKKVFALAEKRGMKVCFAVDVDTRSVLPQEMILTLDVKDRFHNGGVWLPRPDTKGGRKFYKAQVHALMKLYPQMKLLNFIILG